MNGDMTAAPSPVSVMPHVASGTGHARHTIVAMRWYFASFASLIVLFSLGMKVGGTRKMRRWCKWLYLPQYSHTELEEIRLRHELGRKCKEIDELRRDGIGRAEANKVMYETNSKLLEDAKNSLWHSWSTAASQTIARQQQQQQHAQTSQQLTQHAYTEVVPFTAADLSDVKGIQVYGSAWFETLPSGTPPVREILSARRTIAALLQPQASPLAHPVTAPSETPLLTPAAATAVEQQQQRQQPSYMQARMDGYGNEFREQLRNGDIYLV